MGDERVASWRHLDTTPFRKDGTVVSVYRVPDVSGKPTLSSPPSPDNRCIRLLVPSMDAIESRLEKAEVNLQSGMALNKPAKFIALGIKLEARQWVIHVNPICL